MAVRHISMIASAVVALAGSGLSMAEQYRADEYLSLDLSRAVLSPKLLGPAQSFSPGPLHVTLDRSDNSVHAITEPPGEAETTPRFAYKPTRTRMVASSFGVRAPHARVERSTPHKQLKLVALHGRNPVEAQAHDRGIHVWPCKSGGICSWKR